MLIFIVFPPADSTRSALAGQPGREARFAVQLLGHDFKQSGRCYSVFSFICQWSFFIAEKPPLSTGNGQ
jgi:hypothetical protein